MKTSACTMALGSLCLLTGCGFFPPITTSSTSPSSASGDYVYVVNQATDTLSGFVVGAGTLTSIGSVALASGLVPTSVAVTRPNSYVYVAGSGAISCYSIGTGGALTLVSSGGASAIADFVSLDTSPDGQWLFALDSLTLTIYVYKINTATGALTVNATPFYAVPGAGAVLQRSVRISPNGAFIAVALGTGGDLVLPFNTSTGVVGTSNNLAISSAYTDNAVAFDATSSYLLIARAAAGGNGIATYSINASGGLTPVQTLASSGNAPYSLLLDSTGTYVYAANRGDATISGYTFAGGNLTPLGSSPYAAGLAVTALARDNSGKYILAASFGGSPDLTLYSIDAITPGKLDAVASAASGTDPADPVALAATH